MSKFKVGDKVVPKSKSAGFVPFTECRHWDKAQQVNQPFLYVVKARDSTRQDAYILNIDHSETGGNCYAEDDLELYRGSLDLTTPRLITEDILVRVRDNDDEEWTEGYLACIMPNGDIYCWSRINNGEDSGWDPGAMIRWNLVEEIPKKKTVTLELTEEQLEKLRRYYDTV